VTKDGLGCGFDAMMASASSKFTYIERMAPGRRPRLLAITRLEIENDLIKSRRALCKSFKSQNLTNERAIVVASLA